MASIPGNSSSKTFEKRQTGSKVKQSQRTGKQNHQQPSQQASDPAITETVSSTPTSTIDNIIKMMQCREG